MWYGLKEDDKLVAVRFIEHYPSLRDFQDVVKGGKSYKIVGVRVREVGTLA